MISVLGQNIRRIREAKGISAYKLAQIAGVGNSTISQIENGKRQTLNGSTIEKIATALNVDVNQLINVQEEQEYEITELDCLISTILEQADTTIDNTVMTADEKKEFELIVNVAIDFIRKRRFDNEKNSNI